METITVERIVQKLNTLKHLNLDTPGFTNLNINQWLIITDELLNEFYPDNKFIDIEILDNPKLGGMCWINDDYKQKYIENFTEIQFKKIYTKIICLLFYRGKLIFNNDRFGELFSFISENLENFSEIKHIMNFWLNMTFGIYTTSKEIKYKCNDMFQVTKYARLMWNDILNKFKSNIIYIDTDVIYLKGNFDFEKLLKQINRYKLPYKINDIQNGLFIEKKTIYIR